MFDQYWLKKHFHSSLFYKQAWGAPKKENDLIIVFIHYRTPLFTLGKLKLTCVRGTIFMLKPFFSFD